MSQIVVAADHVALGIHHFAAASLDDADALCFTPLLGEHYFKRLALFKIARRHENIDSRRTIILALVGGQAQPSAPLRMPKNKHQLRSDSLTVGCGTIWTLSAYNAVNFIRIFDEMARCMYVKLVVYKILSQMV